MKWAPYLAAVIIVCSGIAAGVYLVMNDHPWFALLVFLLGGSVSAKADSP